MALNETLQAAHVLAHPKSLVSSRPKPGTIGALPNEILRIIFEYVYILAYESEKKDMDMDPTRLRWSPYYVFVICKTWRKVAQSLPLYAQRVMIHVDEPLSIFELEEKINMTKPRRLKVFVVRRAYPSTPASFNEVDQLADRDIKGILPFDYSEKLIIQDLMPILARHVARFQVLVFDLELRSSLPCISHFSGYAAKLQTLRVKSRKNDSTNTDPLLKPNTNIFRTTDLRFLDLDGAIFVRALHIPEWRTSLKTLAQKDLSISNLFAGEYGDFDFYDLVQSLSNENIGHIAKLKLSNIYLRTRRCHDLGNVTINISELEFYGLGYNILAGFFAATEDAIRPNYITIFDCDLTPPAVSVQTVYYYFSSFRLTLKDIDADTSAQDISSFVRNWDGFSLCFERCQNVDDSVFKVMTTVDPTHYEPDAFYVPSCREIAMSPFANITVQTVKDLIVARAQLAQRHSPVGERPSDMFLPMHALWFTGAGPQMSEEDKEWFKAQKLNGFAWYPPKPQQDAQAGQADFNDDGIPFSFLTALPGTAIPVAQTQVDEKSNRFLVTTTHARAVNVNSTTIVNSTTAPPSKEAPRASTHLEGRESPLVEDDYGNMSADDMARFLDWD
ncbi:hypothetical protein CPB83DRAFT_850550 [Crepidotus variabilis]|uniref:F-box domain-containing protein n=1 Tax=Crepidotus variabilis TaxID=179855 RepID=A0A9P6EKK8_9AGAR|nr:hypothetical protein CPB83DRAFT_850550 [Crepidotus variabilis]